MAIACQHPALVHEQLVPKVHAVPGSGTPAGCHQVQACQAPALVDFKQHVSSSYVCIFGKGHSRHTRYTAYASTNRYYVHGTVRTPPRSSRMAQIQSACTGSTSIYYFLRLARLLLCLLRYQHSRHREHSRSPGRSTSMEKSSGGSHFSGKHHSIPLVDLRNKHVRHPRKVDLAPSISSPEVMAPSSGPYTFVWQGQMSARYEYLRVAQMRCATHAYLACLPHRSFKHATTSRGTYYTRSRLCYFVY